MFGEINSCHGMVINAPEVFARKDFMAWLNDPENLTFSWHQKGAEPGEYSDTIVLVDSGFEGTDSNMPEDIWRAICTEVYARFGGEQLTNSNGYAVAVRLTNLEKD